MLRCIGIGAAKDEDIVSDEPLCRPDFLAVDDPFIAIEHCLRAEVGKIRTCIGFTKALTPRNGSRENLGKEFLFLLFGPPLENRRAHERVAKEISAHRSPSICKLFGNND